MREITGKNEAELNIKRERTRKNVGLNIKRELTRKKIFGMKYKA